MKTLYFATGNESKIALARDYLGKYFDLQQADIDIDEIQSDNQEYVALKKVRSAFEILKKPVMVEDVGYYADKYNNFPGVMTKYVINGIGVEGIKQIIKENDRGYFLGIFAYKDFEREFTVIEKICGHFTYSYINTCEDKRNPFGKMIITDGYDKTMAELLKEPENDKLRNDWFERLKNKIIQI